jgi:2-polyprenyl-6-hydroxyphenyl methylase/3-demethylubiquinone-9 3-methyltransferase
MSETHHHNVDHRELDKFAALASRWWDPESEFKPLHEINPLRLAYVDEQAGLAGKRVLDVGCGGGLLAEAMAEMGAEVTGIDMAEANLDVARLHALDSGVVVDYRHTSAEALAAAEPGTFDLITCMELLEHVPDPGSLVAACARLLRPGGDVVLSTLNRNPRSYLFAIVGAEYVLGMIPRGTHDYARFIRPAELEAWCREAGLAVDDLTGLSYNPLTRRYRLGRDVGVNYLAHARRQ